MKNNELTPAIMIPGTNKIYTGYSHKNILKEKIARLDPSAERALEAHVLKDRSGEYTPYIGFITGDGKFIPRRIG